MTPINIYKWIRAVIWLKGQLAKLLPNTLSLIDQPNIPDCPVPSTLMLNNIIYVFQLLLVLCRLLQSLMYDVCLQLSSTARVRAMSVSHSK